MLTTFLTVVSNPWTSFNSIPEHNCQILVGALNIYSGLSKRNTAKGFVPVLWQYVPLRYTTFKSVLFQWLEPLLILLNKPCVKTKLDTIHETGIMVNTYRYISQHIYLILRIICSDNLAWLKSGNHA